MSYRVLVYKRPREKVKVGGCCWKWQNLYLICRGTFYNSHVFKYRILVTHRMLLFVMLRVEIVICYKVLLAI